MCELQSERFNVFDEVLRGQDEPLPLFSHRKVVVSARRGSVDSEARECRPFIEVIVIEGECDSVYSVVFPDNDGDLEVSIGHRKARLRDGRRKNIRRQPGLCALQHGSVWSSKKTGIVGDYKLFSCLPLLYGYILGDWRGSRLRCAKT